MISGLEDSEKNKEGITRGGEEELVRAEARRRGERRRVFASVSRQRDREVRGCRDVIGRWRGRRHRERYTSASPRLCVNHSSSSVAVVALDSRFRGRTGPDPLAQQREQARAGVELGAVGGARARGELAQTGRA